MSLSDVDECLSSPCEHNSTCVDLTDGFACNCSEGWEGNLCQFGEWNSFVYDITLYKRKIITKF